MATDGGWWVSLRSPTLPELLMCRRFLRGVLDPDRLREGPVGRDVPDFEPGPGPAGEVGPEGQGLPAESRGVGEVDPLPVDLRAVAGDDLGGAEGEGPGEVDADL